LPSGDYNTQPGISRGTSGRRHPLYSKRHRNKLSIQAGAPIFGVVADALGVTPDSRVKVLFCVEGPTDVCAFRALSNALHRADANIPDLTTDDRVVFVVLGGSTLNQWVAENHLRALRIPEFHIYDRDVPAYEIAQQEMTVHVPTNIKTRNRVLSAYRRHSGRVRSDCTSH
jgi:hypothetical protein